MRSSSSLLYGLLFAVLLFWAVGAYNRLVRLRGEANAAFAVLDSGLGALTQLVYGLQAVPAGFLRDSPPVYWAGLLGAAQQLDACLASARARPLDPQRMAALAAAQAILDMAWERAERQDAHDLSGPRLPADHPVTRARIVEQCATAAKRFSLAVADYNDAIAQFPAILLAWLFGFKPGRGIDALQPPNP